MPTPRKHEILRKAKGIALERQIRSGLPAITPSEQELKESGAFQEAQIDLMRVDQEALSQQRHYLEEMAGELRLKIIPRKGLSLLKRETGYEWTNGWTKHEKHKPKPKPKAKPKKVPMGILGPISVPKTRKYQVIKAYGTLKVGRILNLGTNVETHSLLRRGIITKLPKTKKEWKIISHAGIPLPFVYPSKKKAEADMKKARFSGLRVIPASELLPTVKMLKKKPKKRKKSHVERSGKTMRVLRKVKGVNVFAFPDDVWKVRKPRKKRRKK